VHATHAHSHSHGHETDSHGYETHGHGHGGENAVSHLLRDETSSNANRDDDVIAETTSWPPRDGPESTPPFPYRFRRNAELPPNAGRGLVLFVDAYTAGIAGDMFVGALLDLGCPLLVVTDALASIKNLTGFALVVTHAEKSCIVAPKFAVLESETQPLRDYRSIKEMLQTSHLSAGVKEKALAAFALLAKGEAEVHGTAIDDVHFHEVGAVDSIVDIVAVSACLDYLNCDSIEISPLPMRTALCRRRRPQCSRACAGRDFPRSASRQTASSSRQPARVSSRRSRRRTNQRGGRITSCRKETHTARGPRIGATGRTCCDW
jgi:hypothetical protein